jgi:hypothetical protein
VRKVILNENTTKQNMNSSLMLYDQDLSDLIDDINKSVYIEDNYMTTNNLNKSYTSNNSQILVNLKLDDWNYYNDEGHKVADDKNDNKELLEERKLKMIKKLREEKKKRAIEVENLHNNQAKGQVRRIEDSINQSEYISKKRDFEQFADFVGDKQIITGIAKANITRSMNKTNSVVAKETLRQMEEEAIRKEKFEKYRVKSQINTRKQDNNDSFNEIMLENYVKNKSKNVKVNLQIVGNNSRNTSVNTNNEIAQNNSKLNSKSNKPSSKRSVVTNSSIIINQSNNNNVNVIKNNSKLFQKEEKGILLNNKQKFKEDVYGLMDKYK